MTARRPPKHRPWTVRQGDRYGKKWLEGYRQASGPEKATQALNRYRPPPMRCAKCLCMVDASQIADHLAHRCAGSVTERNRTIIAARKP